MKVPWHRELQLILLVGTWRDEKLHIACRNRKCWDEIVVVVAFRERVFADDVVSKFWFVRSFYSQHHPKFLANIATENVSQVRIKECKTLSSICKVSLNFLRPSRHFPCDAAFYVIVSFLNESVHGFNNICNGRVKVGVQKVKFRQIWKFFHQKTRTFSLWQFGKLMGNIFPKLQPPIDFP